MDADRIGWPDLRSAYFSAGDKASDYFIGGYLRAVFDRDPEVWEAVIADISESAPRPERLPALVWRSGMTERVAALILQLIKTSRIPPDALHIFSIGRGTDPLSDQMLHNWLDALTNIGSFAASETALTLAAMSMHSGRKLAASQIQNIITQPALFAAESTRKKAHVMLTHHWLELSKKLITLDTTAEVTVLRVLIDSIAGGSSTTYSLGSKGNGFWINWSPADLWRYGELFRLCKPANGYPWFCPNSLAARRQGLWAKSWSYETFSSGSRLFLGPANPEARDFLHRKHGTEGLLAPKLGKAASSAKLCADLAIAIEFRAPCPRISSQAVGADRPAHIYTEQMEALRKLKVEETNQTRFVG